MALIKNLEAFDVYLFKTSGLPLIAGCTGSDYCMNHLPNHELHTAFMAALQSFSRETFSNNTVQTVVMEDFQLNMKVYPQDEFIFGAVHPSGVNTDQVRSLIEKGGNIFLKKYGKELEKDFIKEQVYEDFIKEIRELGLIPSSGVNSVLSMISKETEVKVEKSKKKGLLGRILSR